jgi:hypothetical protein
MIPRLIHQTWRNTNVPQQWRGYLASWPRYHPGWQVRLWTDADLDALVAERAPGLLALFRSYPHPIMRADLGRYIVLNTYGGVYADLDAEALAPFDGLLDSAVPVFAEEPPSHHGLIARARGFARLVSNAVMVSPPGHPFWAHLLRLLWHCRSASGPLDATGPMLLTAAVDSASPPERPNVLPAHIFTAVDRNGLAVPAAGNGIAGPLSAHHWTGSWYEREPPLNTGRRLKTALRRFMIVTRHGQDGPDIKLRDRVDRAALGQPAPADGSVLIAVPVRNAAKTLDQLFRCILALEPPRGGLSIAFLVGDTRDDSAERLAAFERAHGRAFRRFTVVERDFGAPAYRKRWRPRFQRERRSRIARVRNLLLAEALADEDWVMWIDADVVGFRPDTLLRLLATRGRIVQPNCVLTPDGASFDMNAWVEDRKVSEYQHYKFTLNGLYAPPPGLGRVYLSDLRYHGQVALDSVGGTMLLVDARLHRAGVLFPESPYNRLIETEGFAALARDLGITPIGLPNLEIIHVNA